MKKIILITLLLWITTLSSFGFAETPNDFEIIPKSTDPSGVSQAVEAVGKTWWNVRDNYNKQADKLAKKGVGDQLASGIMTRQTLLDYVVYLIRFISQIGLVIGVAMIIYAGYLYATSIFNSSGMSKGKAALTNAIVGVLVVAFSYAIMKLLTSAFLS